MRLTGIFCGRNLSVTRIVRSGLVFSWEMCAVYVRIYFSVTLSFPLTRFPGRTTKRFIEIMRMRKQGFLVWNSNSVLPCRA